MRQPEPYFLIWTVMGYLKANQAAFITMLFRQSANGEPEIVLVYRMNRSIRKIVWSVNNSHLQYKRRKILRYRLVAQWSAISLDNLQSILPHLIE
jgi:hypothetical protein